MNQFKVSCSKFNVFNWNFESGINKCSFINYISIDQKSFIDYIKANFSKSDRQIYKLLCNKKKL
jgi:hypothetical protein